MYTIPQVEISIYSFINAVKGVALTKLMLKDILLTKYSEIYLR